MKNESKRILTLCIALALLGGAVPQSFAEETVEAEKSVYTDTVINENDITNNDIKLLESENEGSIIDEGEIKENYAAAIGSVGYETLQEAVDAALSGETITLLRDIDLNDMILINKNITLAADESAENILIKRTAENNAAMFEVRSNATLKIESGITVDGGAVWSDGENVGIASTQPIAAVYDGKLYIQAGAVLQNNDNASGEGGAVALSKGGSSWVYVYGKISNNRSKKSGGAITSNGFTNIYATAVFEGNKAEVAGGAVNNKEGGVTTVEGGTFKGNSAINGGVIWCDGKTEIRGGAFTENSAEKGTALYVSSSNAARAAIVSGGNFTGNNVDGKGDIYAASSHITLKGSFNADNIYFASGVTASVTGALSGRFTVSSEETLHSHPEVLKGSGYTLKESDMSAIGTSPSRNEAVLSSNAIYLKYPDVNITDQPADKEVFIDDAAELAVNAEETEETGKLSYAWYSCENRNGDGEIRIDGAEEVSYRADTSSAGNAFYFCEITADGSEPTRTSVARVKVMDPSVAEAPEFVTEPSDTEYSFGDTITLTAAARLFDNGVLTYKWYIMKNDAPDPETDELIQGETAESLTLTPKTGDDAYYYCVAVNTVGSSSISTVSRAAKVSCKTKVEMIGAPQTGSVLRTEYKNITAPDIAYSWEISDSADGVFSGIGEGEELAVSEEHEGRYIRSKVTSGGVSFVSEARMVKASGTYNEYSGSYVYLSDVPKSQIKVSDIGYKDLEFDKNTTKNTISLICGGKKKYFTKGLGAHARATLVYDVEEITDNYKFTKFTSYLGLDSAQGSKGNGVKFTISVSDDMSDWTPIKETGTLKGTSEAEYVELDLTGVKYLKIYIDPLGSDESDHSVIAGAKLSRADYEDDSSDYDWIKTTAEYDKEISSYEQSNPGLSYSELINDPEYRALVYKRNFVKNVSYDYLQAFAHTNDDTKAVIWWFMNDKEAIDMYTQGGTPSGSYMNSVNVLAKLYNKHKSDLDDAEFGTLYKRMMITISLTHSTSVPFWADYSITSDPIRRYEIYKKLHDSDLLLNSVFEKLNVEEMRWVMGDLMDDDQIEWLNYYSRKTSSTAESNYNSSNFTMGPYHYIKYTTGYNFYQDKYYNEQNKQMWQSKYFLTQEYAQDSRFDINVPYEYNKPKLWTVFAEGAVCGGISKTGTNLLTVFGVPGVVIGQPGHAAYLRYMYSDNSAEDSPATWTIWNDVSGWTLSEKGERLLCGWGSKSWDSSYQVSYVLLAQAALNDEANYNRALALVRTADTKTDPNERIDIYEQALAIQNINLDAWEGIIYAYNELGKPESDYVRLAQRITNVYTYYPLPMWDVIEKLIKPNISTPANLSEVDIYAQNALTKASVAGDSSTLQPGACKVMANYLLGKKTFEMATFSFDGDKANTIVLSDNYTGSGNQLLYSISGDSEDAWRNAGNVSEVELSREEIEAITAENDILVRLQGTSSYYTIDITQQSAPSGIYANDNENLLIKATTAMEWSTDGANWTKMTSGKRFPGEMTVHLRTAATGTKMASGYSTYSFHEDTSTDERKYITIDHLSIAGCSSYQPGAEPQKVIDGMPSTMWHTVWSGSDSERSISIKLDEPRYLSAMEYTPRPDGGNGNFLTCEIYTSVDGSTWYLADTVTWARTSAKKVYDFKTKVYAGYIKLVGKSTVGGFGSASMIELFEDTTVKSKEISSISITSLPSKISYVVGDELDLTGMIVSAQYTDGTSSNLPYSSLSFSKNIFDSVGEEKISVSVPGAENIAPVEFTVTVGENTKAVTALNIVSMPLKTEYSVGESADLTGLSVKAVYEDGTSGYVFNDLLSVEPGVFESAGETTVTLSYKGASVSFEVQVLPGFAYDYLRYEVVEGSCFVYVTGWVADKMPENGKIEIPSKVYVNGCEYEVIGIAEEAFIGNKDLRSVKFPATVTNINDRAFYGCDNITELDFKSYSSFDTLTIGLDVFGTDSEGITIGGKIYVSNNSVADSFPGISSGAFEIVSDNTLLNIFSALAFDSGYYMKDDQKFGVIRFYAKLEFENVTKQGFVYYDSETEQTGKEIASEPSSQSSSGFFADVYEIPESVKEVSVKAFVVTNGQTIFSDIIKGKVDLEREIDFE